MLLPILFLCALEFALRLAGYGFDPSFFKPLRIGNENYLVQNDDFSFRFFPRETARNPGVFRFLAQKPPGTFRIFIFGESAAMGDPEPAYGAGRYLEVLLREKFPGVKFEIINVAFTAINSHVIVPIARECAAQNGDLWIIYMGNNEMVGPFGAATVFGAQSPPLFYVRLVTGLEKIRVGQLLAAAMRKLAHRPAKATSWGGMQMFLDNRVIPGSPKKEMVYRNFARNLHDILRAGLGQHAKVLLNTVAVNLKDCPPFASISNSNLPPALQSNLNDPFEKAAALNPQSADLQYQWGEHLLRATNTAAARDHLQLACDDDALPFRTDSRLNAIIREAAPAFSDDQLTLLDTAKLLAGQNPAGVCGDETFYEHVHFDFSGSYRLALLWAQQVAKMLPPNSQPRDVAWSTPEQCRQLLGLSDWNEALVLEHMVGRLQIPPFSSQSNNLARIASLQSRVTQLHARMNPGNAAVARENFLKQLERFPADFVLRENFALFSQATGNLPEATAQWRLVHDLIPHDYLPYFQLGKLLAGQAQWSEAETDLRLALQIHPSLTEGWYELGNALASQEKFPEALADYGIARQQRPSDEQTVFRMGRIYAKINQHPAAVELYRQAAELNPSDWEPHYELGGELDTAGQLDDARKEFGEAARLNPNNSRTHFNYGVLLAKQGQLDDAQQEFETALQLEPTYQAASENLAKIRILKHRLKKD